MALFIHFSLSILFCLVGNSVPLLVYLASIPTFNRILKKKSTEGFQSIPYSLALFSAMLFIYYAFLLQNGLMLITINSFGILIESLYLIIYMISATRDSKIFTAKLLILFNLGAFGLILLFTYLFSKASKRLSIVGCICIVFSVAVYAAPIAIMRQVVRTKSVEFMPFPFSLCLTISAVMWFMYGLSIHSYYITAPNLLGLAFGFTQIILYLFYSTRRYVIILPEVDIQHQPNIWIPMTILHHHQLSCRQETRQYVNRDHQVEINTIQLITM